MDQFFSPLQRLLVTWLLMLVTGWLTLNALTYFGELLSVLVTAGLIAFLLNYPVTQLHPWLPRPLAAAIVYLVAGAIVSVLAVLLVPPVLLQIQQLLTNLPELLNSGQEQVLELQSWGKAHHLPLSIPVLEQQILTQLQTQAQTIASTGFGLLLGTFNWLLDFILILVISFYLLLDGEQIWQGVTGFLAPRLQARLTESLRDSLQRFASGQLLLGLFMASTLSLAFGWLQVPFFLVFALFIGLMEIIPFIGATLGIALVVIVVAFIDWWLGLQVLAVAIVLQQIKDNLLAPRILGSLTGLSPVIILVALLVGARVAGLLGVILAIPLTSVVKSLVEAFLNPEVGERAEPVFSEDLPGSVLEPILSGSQEAETKEPETPNLIQPS